MNTPPKPFRYSRSQRPRQESQQEASNRFQWLGPSDDLPDMDFPAFLKLMHDSFAELDYTREAHYYARFRLKNQNPDDPQPKTYPILAREQGTIVGFEQITGLLECFSLSAQRLKDAYNAFYGLVPPAVQAAPLESPKD